MNDQQAHAIDHVILYVQQWAKTPSAVPLPLTAPVMLGTALQLGCLIGSRDPAVALAVAERYLAHLAESCRDTHGALHGENCADRTRRRFDAIISDLIAQWDLAGAPNG